MWKMRNKVFVTFLLFCFGFNGNAFAAPSRNLTVFAEPNLALALTKIARLYSQKSNIIISINFNSSADLINEIDSGEPADVFISAHPDWIATLRQKGVIDIYNIGYIAKDQLALVSPKSNPALATELQNQISLSEALVVINKNKAALIIDDESNSSGKFSNDLLNKLALSDLKLFKKLREDKSSLLNIIKNDPQNYGLLLISQTKNDKDLRVISIQGDSNIFYEALVIAGDNMELAREFLKFLKSDSAKNILRNSGFIID